MFRPHASTARRRLLTTDPLAAADPSEPTQANPIHWSVLGITITL